LKFLHFTNRNLLFKGELAPIGRQHERKCHAHL
jgi:hypothetical protein